MPEVNAQQFKFNREEPGPASNEMARLSRLRKSDPTIGAPRRQFWNSNPNQMALPGMEEHAHPGAVHLAQGYHFRTVASPSVVKVSAEHPDTYKSSAAHLRWAANNGHIEGVMTAQSHRHKGLATALYGMGRTMTAVPPEHSPMRTPDGDAWAPKATAKWGGHVPPNINEEGQIRGRLGKAQPAWG